MTSEADTAVGESTGKSDHQHGQCRTEDDRKGKEKGEKEAGEAGCGMGCYPLAGFLLIGGFSRGLCIFLVNSSTSPSFLLWTRCLVPVSVLRNPTESQALGGDTDALDGADVLCTGPRCQPSVLRYLPRAVCSQFPHIPLHTH